MNIPNGLARYASICQDNDLAPVAELNILLDGHHGIDRTLEVAELVRLALRIRSCLKGSC